MQVRLKMNFRDYLNCGKILNIVYIITGGAIKLTQKMQDRKHTNIELRKIENCRRFLLDQGIVDLEGVIEEIES